MPNDFEWMVTDQRTTPERTLCAQERDLAARAALLARLRYPRRVAEKRLMANLRWEFAGIGKALIARRVGAVVADAYRKEGFKVRQKKR